MNHSQITFQGVFNEIMERKVAVTEQKQNVLKWIQPEESENLTKRFDNDQQTSLKNLRLDSNVWHINMNKVYVFFRAKGE